MYKYLYPSMSLDFDTSLRSCAPNITENAISNCGTLYVFILFHVWMVSLVVQPCPFFGFGGFLDSEVSIFLLACSGFREVF